MTTRGLPIKERFELYVYPEPNTGCWLWGGATSDNGYGYIKSFGKMISAHRFSYMAHKGAIPEGLVLDHLCRVPTCVNPDHLEAVTPKENTRRGLTGWNMAIKTHCPQGHPYDEENTHVNPKGERICKACKKDHNRRVTANRRANGGKYKRTREI